MDIEDLIETEPADPKASILGAATAPKSTGFAAAAKATIDKRASDDEAASIAADAEEPDQPVIAVDEDGDDASENEEEDTRDAEMRECSDPRKLPSWAKVPDGFKIPPGVQVYFVRIRKGLTRTPGKGDRTCILWDLTPADENAAYKRAGGDSQRAVGELAKQMLRSIDGMKCDWTQGPLSNVETFWREIGAKGRRLIIGLYHRAHNASGEETVDFLLRCVAVRSAVRSP